MKTIALRFGETFSPECGTIAAHQEIIDKLGYVWYGKLGSCVAKNMIKELKEQKDAKILLISSGKTARYWAHVVDVSREIPEMEGIPAYYRQHVENFKTWFKITRFESAPKNIMSHCYVYSSKAPLSIASKQSMSPYFIISYDEGE